MRVFYEVALGKSSVREAFDAAVEELELAPAQAAYADRLVTGFTQNRRAVDGAIAGHLTGYDFDRLAEIDRDILRVATYELIFVPEIPPAVSIDEAVEIAKRYSTAESGRFVNGVLGALLRDTPKAEWDPASAPAEEFGEPPTPAPPAEVEEIEVTPDDERFRGARRVAGWKLGDG
jgi:N utilization substance protein B